MAETTNQGLVERVSYMLSAPRRARQREEQLAKSNPHLLEALDRDKREGLVLAVRARWVALAIIAVFIAVLNPRWEVLYYEALIAGFALIGWAQLKSGEVGQSRRELLLLATDLALMTIVIVLPNPFSTIEAPIGLQYRFGNFAYFYVLLAAAVMAYSWRTLFAFGMWTTGLWLGAMGLAIFFGPRIPELSERMAGVFVGYEALADLYDPNIILISPRIQEVVVLIIVTGILALGSWRSRELLIRQAEMARERSNLARHFPPTIVDQMAHQDKPLGHVRSQKVAVMFTDIVGFTRFAEQHPPQKVVDMLREFHKMMEEAVFEHNGTLDKFLGDGIMATFGTPQPGPHDAANALACARDMMGRLDEWNRARRQSGQQPVDLSIGVHYGDVILGDIGSERRMEFATLGDTVNVASRLEAMTRDLSVETVVSEDLVSAVRQAKTGDGNELLDGLKAQEKRAVRGRGDPVKIWTLDRAA